MGKWIAEFDLEDGDKMPEHMDLKYKGAKIDFHCRPLEQEPTTQERQAESDKFDAAFQDGYNNGYRNGVIVGRQEMIDRVQHFLGEQSCV